MIKKRGRPKGTTIDPLLKRVRTTIRIPLWLNIWLRKQDESSGRLVERGLKLLKQLNGKDKLI